MFANIRLCPILTFTHILAYSGSPLMDTEKNRPMRYYAAGILSFVKVGCNVFTFGATDCKKNNWQLTQQSQNPSKYTKPSCFLPWIA